MCWYRQPMAAWLLSTCSMSTTQPCAPHAQCWLLHMLPACPLLHCGATLLDCHGAARCQTAEKLWTASSSRGICTKSLQNPSIVENPSHHPAELPAQDCPGVAGAPWQRGALACGGATSSRKHPAHSRHRSAHSHDCYHDL